MNLPGIRTCACPHAPEASIWHVDLEAALSWADERMLSEDERARAARFVFARDRLRFLAARAATRALLGQALDIAPAQLVLGTGPYGKPLVRNAGPCHFNLSHSQDSALFCIHPDLPVGIDIEHMRQMEDAQELAQRHFKPAEEAALIGLSGDERDRVFLGCWTRKEAVMKAVGWGMYLEPSSFEAGMGPEAIDVVLPEQHATVRVWSLTELPGAVAALALVVSGNSVAGQQDHQMPGDVSHGQSSGLR